MLLIFYGIRLLESRRDASIVLKLLRLLMQLAEGEMLCHRLLNMDVSTTMILKPGKVVDFLLENQNVKNIQEIDWIKARRMLRNLRVKTFPSNIEYKIIGLSEKSCRKQTFLMHHIL